MQVLTPSGYVDASTLRAGDPLCAFDADTGAPIINYLERLERWQPFMDGLRSWDCADDSEIGPQFSPWTFYLINGTRTLFGEQSIWRNGTNVCHVRDLVVGDTIYDEADNPIVIIGIGETAAPDIWYRFAVSGDHSYIADGLTLHNASRFAVNSGAVDWTWDLSTTTHWASSTGGAGGQSAPGSADTVTFDGSSGGHVVTFGFGGTGTFQSVTCGAFTGTLDNSVNNNNVTLSATAGLNGSGSGVRTLNLGNGTWTLSGNNAALDFTTTTNLTFNANSSTISFTGSGAGTKNVTLGGKTFATVSFGAGPSGTSAGYINFSSAGTITTLNVSGPNYIALNSATTLTITNAISITGTSGSEIVFASNNFNSTATLSSANNGSFSWCAFRDTTFTGGGTFSATSSFDLGHNSGATITAPSAGGGMSRARAFAGFA